MPIFKIENNRTKQLKTSNFKNEKELQDLIENNLEEIFGGIWSYNFQQRLTHGVFVNAGQVKIWSKWSKSIAKNLILVYN